MNHIKYCELKKADLEIMFNIDTRRIIWKNYDIYDFPTNTFIVFLKHLRRSTTLIK